MNFKKILKSSFIFFFTLVLCFCSNFSIISHADDSNSTTLTGEYLVRFLSLAQYKINGELVETTYKGTDIRGYEYIRFDDTDGVSFGPDGFDVEVIFPFRISATDIEIEWTLYWSDRATTGAFNMSNIQAYISSYDQVSYYPMYTTVSSNLIEFSSNYDELPFILSNGKQSYTVKGFNFLAFGTGQGYTSSSECRFYFGVKSISYSYSSSADITDMNNFLGNIDDTLNNQSPLDKDLIYDKNENYNDTKVETDDFSNSMDSITKPGVNNLIPDLSIYDVSSFTTISSSLLNGSVVNILAFMSISFLLISVIIFGRR